MSDENRAEVEAQGLTQNINEAVVEDDEPEVEGHGSLPNTNETVVEDEADSD